MTYGDAEFAASLQAVADAEHARQPVCSWCKHLGEPYEHRGIRFDGLIACQGERLCPACADLYLERTPLLAAETAYGVTRVWDLNPNTQTEETEPPAQCIAAAYRYRDWPPPGRRKRRT